jgi:hypothetical protein
MDSYYRFTTHTRFETNETNETNEMNEMNEMNRNLAEGCKPGRRAQTWQKGANLAEGCKPGRRVQTWQKGTNLAEVCKRCRKWVSPLHPCTFCTFEPDACSGSLAALKLRP